MRERHPNFRQIGQTNRFLRSLSPGDGGLLSPFLSRVECRCGETLAVGQKRDAMVYFPETIVVGMEIAAKNTAVGLIGREGLVGWTGLLGAETGCHQARVLMGGGWSLAIPVDRFRQACFVSPTLTLGLLRFVQAFTMQMSWSLLAARSNSLGERLSGLLLMIHDRVDGDEIPATHRALAAHLGVRRATVTDTLHVLEGEQALRSERGRIIIRDRQQIESLAGSSYGATSNHHRNGDGSSSDRTENGRASERATLREQIVISAPGGRSAGFA